MGVNEPRKLVFHRWAQEKMQIFFQVFSIILKVLAIENITKKMKNTKGL